MIVAFTIPEWVLWAVGLGVGVPALAVLLAFAWVGYELTKSVGRGLNW